MLCGAVCVAFTLAALSSCVMDYGDNCPERHPGAGYMINLSVTTGSLNTRTAGHDPRNNTEEDSFINIAGDDFAIFILDDKGNFVDRFWPSGTSCQQPAGTEEYQYQVFGVYQPDASNMLSKIRLAVMANWRAVGGRYNFDPTGKTLNDLYADAASFNFTIPVTPEAGGDKISWTPVIGSKGIPMFGVSTDIDLDKATDAGIDCSISALRSVAKVEILDKIPDSPANITKCVLTSYSANGRFIPDGQKNPEWNKDGTQVTTPSMPSAVTKETKLQFVKTQQTVSIEGTEVVKDCFVAYIPEMDLSGLTVSDDSRPIIEIYVEGVSTPYIIELSEYGSDGKPKPKNAQGDYSFYSALLRNHIYHYNILSIGSTILDFEVETPWGATQDQEWGYEDLNAEFTSGKGFAWNTATTVFEESIPEEQRTLIISQDRWVEGSFQLSEPAKGTWTIALYGDDNTLNDHFRIDRWGEIEDDTAGTTEGWVEGSDALTGKVGEDVRFRIIPTAINSSSEHYKARIVMTCMTFDGRISEVNLVYVVGNNGKTVGMTVPTVDSNDYYYVKQYFSGLGDAMSEE